MIRLLHRGFNYSQDGPGNRLVYHLQGCNLHCPWCSNPESIPLTGSLTVPDAGALMPEACPFGAIAPDGLNRALCRDCREKPCAALPGSGVKLTGAPVEEEAILGEIERSRPMFFDGGGVTFTGGEPTLQFEALARLLEALKARGVHTALETNGTHPQLPALFPLIDFLILDVKHYDAARHARVIGGGQPQIRRNLTAALARREQLAVRIPLIGGFNAGEEDAAGFAALFREAAEEADSSFAQKATLELLRYHEYGKDKWAQCGREYAMTEAAFVSDEQLAAFERVIRAAGLPLVHT